MAIYDYLMLRLRPDAARGESLNAGIAVFTPSGARVRLRVEPSRARALHPALAKYDWEVEATMIESRLAPLERHVQEFFLRTSIAPLYADERSGQLVAADETELETRIDEIMTRYITVPAVRRQRREASRSRLHNDLRRWLRGARVFSANVADISRNRVVPNYPIVANAGLFAEFALQNGAIHVIETLDLRGLDHLSHGRFGDAAVKSVILDQAKETSPNGRRMAVIAADDYGAVRSAVNMIGKYADDVIAYEQAVDRQRLAGFLADALHLQTELIPLPA